MRIGKREQIVVGVVLTIALIAVLHLLIFSPSAKAYREKRTVTEQLANQIRGLQTITNPQALENYNKDTEKFLVKLKDGISELALDQPEAYVIKPVNEVVVEPVAGEAPQDTQTRKENAHAELVAQKKAEQRDLILKEVERLRNVTTGKRTQMKFLETRGWNIPTQLPQGMAGARLWDTLKEVSNIEGILNVLTTDSDAYAEQRRLYENLLRRLGLDIEHAKSLRKYGEYVPFYYQMAFANLIMAEVEKRDQVLVLTREVMTPDYLLDLLDLKLPYDVVPDVNESKMYFAYEGLKNLNELLAVAEEQEIRAVWKVEMRGWGYLKQMDKLADPPNIAEMNPEDFADDEVKGFKPRIVVAAGADPAAPEAMATAPNPLAPAPGAMSQDEIALEMQRRIAATRDAALAAGTLRTTTTRPGEEGEEKILQPKPQADEIGFAILIKLETQASYYNTIRFIYEVLRQRRMWEVHRLEIESLSLRQPNLTDVYAKTTFVVVPKLFELKKIRDVLDEIAADEAKQQAQQTPAPEPSPPGVQQ